MVLAGILVQSLPPSLVGFDLSVISRIRLLEVHLSVSFFVLDKSFVRRRYLLTSVERHLLQVSVPAFRSQSLKIVYTVGSC